MSDFMLYFFCPIIVCLFIVVLSVDAYKKNIDKVENVWYWVNDKKLAWLFCFTINLLSIHILMFSQKVYLERKFIRQTVIENIIATDSIQSDSLITNNSGRFVTHVTLTTYNPVEGQCDDTPLITADGTKIDLNKLKKGEIKYCAISRNLLPFIPLGSVIEIEGYGLYEVRDTMNKRFNHCIDILQYVGEKNFKKTKVKVVKIK